jgi:hypothetical protein
MHHLRKCKCPGLSSILNHKAFQSQPFVSLATSALADFRQGIVNTSIRWSRSVHDAANTYKGVSEEQNILRAHGRFRERKELQNGQRLQIARVNVTQISCSLVSPPVQKSVHVIVVAVILKLIMIETESRRGSNRSMCPISNFLASLSVSRRPELWVILRIVAASIGQPDSATDAVFFTWLEQEHVYLFACSCRTPAPNRGIQGESDY